MASMLDVGDEPSSSAAMVLDDAPTTSMAALLGGRLELPVERNAMEGVWMQATNYAQPDLHEDLTVEVDGGPLAEFAPAGTAVVSVAIVGDRNAGKSTFLHAFVNERDRDWLKVTSVLPAISGSFRNARYGTVGPCVPGGAPLAEAPYIDTDVACATAVLTIEDFAFFCNDFGLPDLLASVADASYVALRFVELGGDHLEALVNGPPPAASSLLLAALEKSRAALARADGVAYFADARRLDEGLRQRLRRRRGPGPGRHLPHRLRQVRRVLRALQARRRPRGFSTVSREVFRSGSSARRETSARPVDVDAREVRRFPP